MSISTTRIPVPPFHLEPAYHDKTDVPGKESMSSISGLRANKLPDFANSTLLESARVVHCGKHSDDALKGKVVCPRCMQTFGSRSPAFENAAFKHTENQCLYRQQSAFGLRSDQLRYSWIDANDRYSVGPNTIGNVSAHISTQGAQINSLQAGHERLVVSHGQLEVTVGALQVAHLPCMLPL